MYCELRRLNSSLISGHELRPVESGTCDAQLLVLVFVGRAGIPVVMGGLRELGDEGLSFRAVLQVDAW